MGEWLLTVEERRKIWDDATNQKVGDWEDELLKAQLRKVMEWGYRICHNAEHSESFPSICLVCPGCVRELHKEAGLDV